MIAYKECKSILAKIAKETNLIEPGFIGTEGQYEVPLKCPLQRLIYDYLQHFNINYSNHGDGCHFYQLKNIKMDFKCGNP